MPHRDARYPAHLYVYSPEEDIRQSCLGSLDEPAKRRKERLAMLLVASMHVCTEKPASSDLQQVSAYQTDVRIAD